MMSFLIISAINPSIPNDVLKRKNYWEIISNKHKMLWLQVYGLRLFQNIYCVLFSRWPVGWFLVGWQKTNW